MTKIVIVIPCYNEAKFIGTVVRQAATFCDAVIVADDISTDDTVGIAVRSGAIVCTDEHGYTGAGAMSRRGIQEALSIGADVVVTLDGDGQHDTLDIPQIVQPVLDDRADLVVGTRFRGIPCSFRSYRRLGIQIITGALNIGSKTKFSDGQCCFRAYSRKLLGEVTITENGFSFSVETLVKARRLGFRVVEIPVGAVYHAQLSDNSTLNPVIHGLIVLLGVLKWRTKIELLRRR